MVAPRPSREETSWSASWGSARGALYRGSIQGIALGRPEKRASYMWREAGGDNRCPDPSLRGRPVGRADPEVGSGLHRSRARHGSAGFRPEVRRKGRSKLRPKRCASWALAWTVGRVFKLRRKRLGRCVEVQLDSATGQKLRLGTEVVLRIPAKRPGGRTHDFSEFEPRPLVVEQSSR